MTSRHCLRCGSTDLLSGVIYERDEYGRNVLRFQWKPDSVWEPDSVKLNAIMCKSCGYTELIADLDVFIPKVERECPHCKKIYAYREEDKIGEDLVKCPYCEKKFKIHPPKKCPYCGAVYLYNKEMILEGTVVCQNCSKVFPIDESSKSEGVIDDIEDEQMED